MKKFFSNFPLILAPIIIFAFFLPSLISGKIPIPADSILSLYHPFRDISIDGFSPGRFPAKNPLITDPVLQTSPWRKLVVEAFKNKEMPLWNPYSFSGQPLLANLQSAPFSITNLLFFIFPFKAAWSVQIILPQVLAGLFMYLFLKEINLSKTASVFGAAILPFSGFFIAWLEWGTIIQTAMWLPLILYLILRFSKKISAPVFALLALSFSQVIFSGHLQTALYVLLTALAFLIYMYAKEKNLPLDGEYYTNKQILSMLEEKFSEYSEFQKKLKTMREQRTKKGQRSLFEF